MTAPLIVGTFNLWVIQAMGEDCGITEKEAQFLIPSTQRTLERMPKGAAERLAVFIDPAIIIAVMGMWMKRAVDIKRAQALQKYVVGPQERARANGVSGTEYQVQQPPADPGDDNGMSFRVTQSDWPENSNYVPPIVDPTGEGVPTPKNPDFTANGVPTAIRDSFDSAL